MGYCVGLLELASLIPSRLHSKLITLQEVNTRSVNA